ncbi:YidH family protein [Kerstersia similis]|uniref:YidH family protein n=1 Tax=Kerstersia similis TaxID=206505 RepID=UPI0039EE9D9B
MLNRPRWQQEGQDPDYRFTLANERTFLAWIRTALALLAGGVALDQFASQLGPPGTVRILALCLALLAALLCLLAYLRWRQNERAMRLSQGLPHTPAIPLLAAALGGIAIIMAIML